MGSDKHGLKILFILAAVLVAVSCAGMCLGTFHMWPWQVIKAVFGDGQGTADKIILLARLPRVCGCILAGAALAVSGTVIQSVLANELAAPNIIGVNSGAGLAVALCCAVAPTALYLVPAAAFIGALAGVSLVLFIAERTGASRMTLVLSGVAISNIFSAGIDTVVTLVPDALLGYSDFKIGGMGNMSMDRLDPAAWIIIACLIVTFSLANELDVLTLGMDTARSLGMRAKGLRFIFLALAAALSGAAVSFSGLIGFVGLVVPHITRRILKGDSRFLLIASAMGGGAMLTACDTLARTLFAPYELPVGIVMAFVGGPFFIWLLIRQRRGRVHD